MISHQLSLKTKRNNFIRERPIYNPAVSDPEGKGTRHASPCPFFKRLIRARYKFQSENVFVSKNGLMHIGLLLIQRPGEWAVPVCNSLETNSR
jgi:hypothetical protein